MIVPDPPKGMTDEEKKRVVERLQRAGANQHCPRCLNTQFILADGYFPFSMHPNQQMLGAIIAGGPVVPAVAVACARCGWLAFHASEVLLKEPEAKNG